jgi:hypothetical protein
MLWSVCWYLCAQRTPRNIAEERRRQVHRGESLETSRIPAYMEVISLRRVFVPKLRERTSLNSFCVPNTLMFLVLMTLISLILLFLGRGGTDPEASLISLLTLLPVPAFFLFGQSARNRSPSVPPLKLEFGGFLSTHVVGLLPPVPCCVLRVGHPCVW